MWEVYAAIIAPLLVLVVVMLITASLIDALLGAIAELRNAL